MRTDCGRGIISASAELSHPGLSRAHYRHIHINRCGTRPPAHRDQRGEKNTSVDLWEGKEAVREGGISEIVTQKKRKALICKTRVNTDALTECTKPNEGGPMEKKGKSGTQGQETLRDWRL